MTYEQMLQELNTITDTLREPDLPLEEMLKAYSRGRELVAEMTALLEKAELKVRELSEKLPEAGE